MPELGTVAGAYRNDPLRKFQFKVYTKMLAGAAGQNPIPRESAIGFMSVSGLGATTETAEYKEGDKTYTRKIPGKTKFENITLSRGIDRNNLLYAWRRRVEEQGGESDEELRAVLVIEVFDRRRHGDPLKVWECEECWPMSYSADELSGDSSDVWIEKVEFACEKQQQTRLA